MSARVICLLALACASLDAQNAVAVLPCDNKSVQKDVDAFRVVTTRLVYVNCDTTTLTQFDTSASLNVIDKGQSTPVAGATGSVHLFRKGEAWLQINLTKAGGPEILKTGQDYEIVLAPDNQATVVKFAGTVQGPFELLKIPISTKPAATIKPGLVQDLGVTFEIYSPLALRAFGPNDPKFAEVILSKLRIYHQAMTQPKGPTVTECQANETCPVAPLGEHQSPADYGRAFVKLETDHLYQAKATLDVTGLNDAFNQPLKIQNEVALGAIPKTKDDAAWYLKLDHQAGPGSKPGVAIEAKVAPTLGRPLAGGFFWQPAFNMDIGSGSVSNVKVNDTIVPSLGVTRLWRYEQRGLEALRYTPALSFETNREFNKRNLVFDQDFKFFLSGMTATRLERSWAKYNKFTAEQKKDIKFRPDLADGGTGVQSFLGSELGHSIGSVTVKASKSSASVVVPAFSVARIRPKLSAFVEYKRLNLTLSAAPRYLFTKEYTTRESADGKSIQLVPVSGFRPYGEAGITIGLDSSGHIALNTTYKLGSQPPTFQYANTVQTGLLLKY